MKTSTILWTAVMAITSVHAAALPEAEPATNEARALVKVKHTNGGFPRFCHLPGQPCKRAADAANSYAEAAEAAAQFLKMRGADAEPEEKRHIIHFCHLPGQACKRAEEAAAVYTEAVDGASKLIKTRTPEDEFDRVDKRRIIHFCHLPGQPCKRAEEATEALDVEKRRIIHFCHLPGQAC